MSAEKITKEELLNTLGGKALSDDELEIVTGGSQQDHELCLSACTIVFSYNPDMWNQCAAACPPA